MLVKLLGFYGFDRPSRHTTSCCEEFAFLNLQAGCSAMDLVSYVSIIGRKGIDLMSASRTESSTWPIFSSLRALGLESVEEFGPATSGIALVIMFRLEYFQSLLFWRRWSSRLLSLGTLVLLLTEKFSWPRILLSLESLNLRCLLWLLSMINPLSTTNTQQTIKYKFHFPTTYPHKNLWDTE